MTLPKLKFKNTVIESAWDKMHCFPMHKVRDYWIGFGYLQTRTRRLNTYVGKRRRFLRVRNKAGICSYIYLTMPKRYEVCPVCFGFVKVKQLDREEAAAIVGEATLSAVD